MILCTENPKNTIRKLLELISEFSKLAGYKINTKKSLAFLYTNNEKSEREVKESIPFTTATKRIEISRKKPTEGDKRTVYRKTMILMKEVKDNINSWRDSSCSWVGRINIMKMTILQMQSADSMQSLLNYLAFFTEVEQKNFTTHMETQNTSNSQNSLEKEEWRWRNHPS